MRVLQGTGVSPGVNAGKPINIERTLDFSIEATISQIPTGRLGEPEEIARCVVFLASKNSGFINGSTISANGAQFFV